MNSAWSWTFCQVCFVVVKTVYFIAIIQTGMVMSGKPSCLSMARTSRPALAMMLSMMSRWRLMLLSMGSSLQPCRAILSFMMMTPFGRRLLLHRIRKSNRSLSVKWPEVKRQTEPICNMEVSAADNGPDKSQMCLGRWRQLYMCFIDHRNLLSHRKISLGWYLGLNLKI